ncbi:MAG: SDR family NAD(P)-dependent oxidoreductase, partial [Planctomycetota bacterium]
DFEDAHRLRRILDINLTANLYLIGAVLPGMLERRRGHIVGVSSLAGYRGLPGSWVYSASKAGLSTLLEGLRIDLRPHGVDVTTISPGFIKTAITARNRFPMPFLMDLEPAVRIMCRGIERRAREVRMPWQLALLMRLLRAIPDPLYDWIASRMLPRADKAPARDSTAH